MFFGTPDAVAAPIGEEEPSIRSVALVSIYRHPERPKTPPTSLKTSSGGSFEAFITGYNTVPGQTDSTPCTAAGGEICGRRDVVACPSSIPLHSWVEIDGQAYECMDRTAEKFDGRFDVSCDKDMTCPYKLTGWKTVRVIQYAK